MRLNDLKKTMPSLQRWELMYRTAISQFEIIANNIRHDVSSRIYTQRVIENVSTKFKVFDIVWNTLSRLWCNFPQKKITSAIQKREIVHQITQTLQLLMSLRTNLAVLIEATIFQVFVSGSYRSTVLRLVPSEPPTAYTMSFSTAQPTPNRHWFIRAISVHLPTLGS